LDALKVLKPRIGVAKNPTRLRIYFVAPLLAMLLDAQVCRY